MIQIRQRAGEGVKRAAQRLLRRRSAPGAPAARGPLWDARFFGLDRVACFRAANASQRREVLERCADALLNESWFIEQSGITYCARMTLAAQSPEEQRLYAMIGGDEAAHALWLSPWIRVDKARQDPFNVFISSLSQGGAQQPLAYLLQVVLEGYGITHYRALAQHCRDDALTATFTRMARDEALHHGSGLALFDAPRLTAADMCYVFDSINVFLNMLRNGPQAVVAALDCVIGLPREAAAQQVFDELHAPTASARKLAQLRRLMEQPGMQTLVDAAARGGLFEPCSAAQCAQIYVASRRRAAT